MRWALPGAEPCRNCAPLCRVHAHASSHLQHAPLAVICQKCCTEGRHPFLMSMAEQLTEYEREVKERIALNKARLADVMKNVDTSLLA